MESDPLYVKYDPALIEYGFKLAPAKAGDVGLDLPVVMDERLKIDPFMNYYINFKERWFDIPGGGSAEVPCGLSIKTPSDAWANIKSRSSTMWKRKLHISEGVIDSGYIGPLYVLVHNPNAHPIRIHEFDRLAQIIVLPKYNYGYTHIVGTEKLPSTERGDTGFGSSGGMKAQEEAEVK
jgi:dUTP pyrophosphatase